MDNQRFSSKSEHEERPIDSLKSRVTQLERHVEIIEQQLYRMDILINEVMHNETK